MGHSSLKKRLSSMLNSRGFYLHIFEVIEVNEASYARVRVRFPCRLPADLARKIYKDEDTATEMISYLDRYLIIEGQRKWK